MKYTLAHNEIRQVVLIGKAVVWGNGQFDSHTERVGWVHRHASTILSVHPQQIEGADDISCHHRNKTTGNRKFQTQADPRQKLPKKGSVGFVLVFLQSSYFWE